MCVLCYTKKHGFGLRVFTVSERPEKRGLLCLASMQWGIIFVKQYLFSNASNQKTKATLLSKTFNFVYTGAHFRGVFINNHFLIAPFGL